MTEQNTTDQIELYRERAEGLTILTPEDYTKAEGWLKELRAAKKGWLAAVEATVKAAHESHKAAVAHRDSVKKPIEVAERAVRDKISAYANEQRRLAEAERQRLQAKADAEAEAERKRKMAAAEKLKTPELREQRIEEAEMVTAPVIVTAPKVPETALRSVTRWKATVIDVALVPREYMVPDAAQIGAMVRATKGKVAIPGVRIYSETKSQ